MTSLVIVAIVSLLVGVTAGVFVVALMTAGARRPSDRPGDNS